MKEDTKVLEDILDTLEGWDFEAFPEYVLNEAEAKAIFALLAKWQDNRIYKKKYYGENKERLSEKSRERYNASKMEVFNRRKHD